MSRVRRKGTTNLRSSGRHKLESGTDFRDMLDPVRMSAPSPASRPRPGRIGALAAGQGAQEHIRDSPRKPTDSTEFFFFLGRRDVRSPGSARPRQALRAAGGTGRYQNISMHTKIELHRVVVFWLLDFASLKAEVLRTEKQNEPTAMENTAPPCPPDPASSL